MTLPFRDDVYYVYSTGTSHSWQYWATSYQNWTIMVKHGAIMGILAGWPISKVDDLDLVLGWSYASTSGTKPVIFFLKT